MADPAAALFDSLSEYSKIQELIDSGEAEGAHLECKAPGSPQLTREQKVKLAEAVSGFGNTGGGVIVFGVSTVKHAHSGLDVLTQIEPIGHCRRLAHQVDRAVSTLTHPVVQSPPSKVLLAAKGDTKGVVVSYIPPTPGDPIQSLLDRKFYFRNADEFSEMPYEILKKMFMGAAGPDLVPVFDARIVETDAQGAWTIPIALQNESSSVAEKTRVLVTILNPDACQEIIPDDFVDISKYNPGQRIFRAEMDSPIFRGLRLIMGTLRVSMKKGKRPKRVLNLQLEVFSSRMRARRWKITVQLAKKGFSVKEVGDAFIY